MKLRFLLFILLVPVALGAWSFFSTDHQPPLPTEHRLDRDAEHQNSLNRKAWLEELHRTGPDTDWRAIERDNGRALQLQRNAMVERGGHDSRWNEVGSRNQAGRMHVSAYSVAGDSLYGGSSLGGVWKASLSGENWRPLGDNLWGGSHGLAIAGTDPEVITSITDGGGLHYSLDGGQTWVEPDGIGGNLYHCHRVSSDASDSERVILLANNASGPALFLSTDAGRSYQQVRQLSTGTCDFWLDRRQGGNVYLLDGNRLYRSNGSLAFWTRLGDLPYSNASGGVLTGSEAGAPTFYVAAKIGTQWLLYQSTDAGGSWTYRYAITDFWETLCASTINPDLVAFAGVELWRSTDGGDSFLKFNNWWDYYDDPVNKLHADFPGLDCLPTPGGRETWYAATDGGLYRSDDGLATVTNISLTGLGVSQYYSTLTSSNDPNLLLAGAQDQGYQRSTGPGRGPSWDFEQLISGDYGHLTSSDGSHRFVFSVYPGFILVQQGEDQPSLPGTLDFPAEESHGWMPFIVADPDHALSFYFCASHLYRGTWSGGSNIQYTASEQDFTVAGGEYLTALGIAPSDHQRRIAVVNNGRIWYTDDGGDQWRLSQATGPGSHYFYGTAIVHSGSDPDHAWIGGSGYSGPGVWRTMDGGITWQPAGTGLPSTLVYGLALESPTNDVLYAATQAGPYRLDPQTDQWQYIGGDTAPLTTYWCVEAVPAAQVVRFGTYGRGIWDYATETISPVPDIVNNGLDLNLSSAPNPFNPRTTIAFHLPTPGPTQVSVHDIAGRKVAALYSGSLEAGDHNLVWDGRDERGQNCASGVYLVQVAARNAHASLRVVLVR